MKRMTEKLHITIDYIPNDNYEQGDDWELSISVNDDTTGRHNFTPFGVRLKDLTLRQILERVKESVEEELFE